MSRCTRGLWWCVEEVRHVDGDGTVDIGHDSVIRTVTKADGLYQTIHVRVSWLDGEPEPAVWAGADLLTMAGARALAGELRRAARDARGGWWPTRVARTAVRAVARWAARLPRVRVRVSVRLVRPATRVTRLDGTAT